MAGTYSLQALEEGGAVLISVNTCIKVYKETESEQLHQTYWSRLQS